MADVLVLGSGVFGRRAAGLLAELDYRVVVVDKSAEALAGLEGIQAEAVAYLSENLGRFTWVVPAIPIHVVFEWVLARAASAGIRIKKLNLPPSLDVPNAFWQDGTVYASMANHLCPPDCPEPLGFCFITGEDRARPLNVLLANLVLQGLVVDVLRSHQLAPGVGGLKVAEMSMLYEKIIQNKKGIIATSCSCHAVINGYRRLA